MNLKKKRQVSISSTPSDAEFLLRLLETRRRLSHCLKREILYSSAEYKMCFHHTVNTLHFHCTQAFLLLIFFQETIRALSDIYKTHKDTVCEKCLTQCTLFHGETCKRIFRISMKPNLWKRKQYKAAVRGARRLLQYCQLPGKISRDILRYIWSVCCISKKLFSHSTIGRETLAVKCWFQGFK